MSLSVEQTEAIFDLTSRNEDVEVAFTALRTCVTLLENVSKDRAKYAQLKASSKALCSKLLDKPGGAETVAALGFAPNAGEDTTPETLTFTWREDLDEAAAAARAGAVRAALASMEGVRDAVVLVGDSNSPAAAQEALKLCGTYVGNIAVEPDNEGRRRVGAANKALNGRLLSVGGGGALLAACGFAPMPSASEPEAYVCTAELPTVRLALGVLGKASAIWAELAAARGDDDGGGGRPRPAPEVPAVAVDDIRISALPPASSLSARVSERADMQPAVVLSDDGLRAEVHVWHLEARRWCAVGSMQIPSTDFVWARKASDGVSPAMLLLVNLGDGKPVDLVVQCTAAGELDNEYVSASIFISQHDDCLNSGQHLEEMASKVRAAVTPTLQTVRALKRAMEQQN